MHPHESEAIMGSSIGDAGLDWSSGTLGGYLTVQSPTTKESSLMRRRELEVTRKHRKTYQRVLAEIDAFDRRVGHVWATSGYRVAASGCALDSQRHQVLNLVA